MAVMVTMLTRADLDALPDDNRRHELIDGQLIMTPAPGTNHQTVADALTSLLRSEVRGTELKAVSAPFDVVLGDHVVEPDVVVARRQDLTGQDLPAAPVLVIEVLSPSTRQVGLGRKRDLYAEAGVPHYWIVDPEEPAFTIYELTDHGGYTEVAHATGDQPLTVTHPIPLTLTPADLLDD